VKIHIDIFFVDSGLTPPPPPLSELGGWPIALRKAAENALELR
jgi:hypothetical protein